MKENTASPIPARSDGEPMIRHVVMFKLKPGYSGEEKKKHLAHIKSGLERLVGVVPGLVSLHVAISPLPGSECDFMLDSELESRDALAAYQRHPEHVAMAEYIGGVRESRCGFDYEI